MEFYKKLQHFLEGNGFYLVLGLCVLAILASAWVILSSSGLLPWQKTDTEPEIASVQTETPVLRLPEEETEEDEEVIAIAPELTPDELTKQETPSTQQPASVTAEETEPVPVQTDDTVFESPLNGSICVGYFVDELVYDKTMEDWRTHAGIDIAAEIGSRVLCTAAGTVTAICEDALLGTTVIVDHGDGLCSYYANLASVPAVAIGDTVECGTLLGSVGDTAIGESSEVSHLHFAMTRDGIPCDPTEYLPQ